MAKKKLKENGIFFVGKSSDDVTGSQYYIRFGETQCLLECGLHQSQSNNYLDSYKENSKKFIFKPSELDFVFILDIPTTLCETFSNISATDWLS